MASGAVIGALRVVLGADTAALDKGLKEAQSSLANFSRSVASITAGVGLERIIEKSVSGIVGAINHAITAADELGKASQKLGIPVEELSKLKYAADLADVSFESLSKGLVKFDKNMVAAAAGAENDFSRALRAMGLEVKNTDGTLKSQSDLLSEVAGKFQSYEDGAEKTALANALFNKQGASLIPLLNQGADGFKKAADEATRFGLVVTKEAAAKSEEFNDNLKRLHAIINGLVIIATNALVESLSGLSDQFVEGASNAEKFTSAGKTIAEWFTEIGKQIKLAAIEVPGFFNELVSAASAWKATLTLQGDANDKWEEHRKLLLTNEAAATAATVKFNEFAGSVDGTKTAVAGLTNELGKAKAPILGAGADAKSAVQSFLDATQRSTEARNIEAATVGKAAGEAERLKVAKQAELLATQNQIPVTAALNAEIQKTAIAAGDAATKLQGQNLVFENLAPLQKFQLELTNSEAAMRSVGATADQIANNQQKVATKFGLSWEAIGSTIAGTAGALSQLTGTFARENKAMGIASKAFGIAQAIINTQIAITKALATLPPPASYAAVALAVAQGAAAVASISAQSFAMGGSFTVPGGMSSTDNRLVPLNLASGERVDVTPANETAGAGTSTINIDLRGGETFYSRSNIERMLNAMHTVLADGHNVQLVVLK